MRHCYECDAQTNEIDFHGEKVDKCEKCGGLFFDKGELSKIVHLAEVFHNIHIEEEDIDSVPQAEHQRIVYCPADKSEMKPMDIAGLIIDVCPDCGGVWLDDGEISALKLAENHIKQNLQLYIRLGE